MKFGGGVFFSDLERGDNLFIMKRGRHVGGFESKERKGRIRTGGGVQEEIRNILNVYNKGFKYGRVKKVITEGGRWGGRKGTRRLG
jgi:hypothetical protein